MKFQALALIAFSILGLNAAQAKTVTITCGSDTNAIYDALESGDLTKAEFALVITLRGQNNPPQATLMRDDFEDRTEAVRSIRVNSVSDVKSVVVDVAGGRYEIANLSCADLDSSTGDVTYSRATPRGFSGYTLVASAKCNCVTK